LAFGVASTLGQNTSVPSGLPTRVEITQHNDAEKGGAAAAILDRITWPLTIGILVVLFYGPIGTVLERLGREGFELSVHSVGLKTAMRAPLGEDELSFKTADPGVLTNVTTTRTLLRLLQEPGFRDYVVIDLGGGNEWITSRLFIFSVMLERIKRIRCVVFVEGSVPKFLGTAKPDHVHWALAKEQPWLEKAYVEALAKANQPVDILNHEGAILPQIAEEVCRSFVTALTSKDLPKAEDKQWIPFKSGVSEHATWLPGSDIVRIVGEDLHTDAIVANGDQKAEARALLKCSAPWVARVTATRELESIIDRGAFLNELAAKVLARLEVQTAKIN
jgi:hypothetical protein